jgi:hypothetical protein
MPPVPSACQPLADQVATLKQQYSAAAAQAGTATGAEAWTALARAGTVLESLTAAEAALDACVKTHSAALTGTVVVIDAGAGQPEGQSATLWDLTGPLPVAGETTTVSAGAFGFQGPLPTAAAVTIRTTDGDATLTGADFRSGALASPIGGQSPRVEIVLGPTFRISVEELHTWASAFQPVVQQLGVPVGSPLSDLRVTVNAVDVALDQGTVTVIATGWIAGSVMQTPFPQTAVSAAVTLAVAPSLSPLADDVVTVDLAGTNPVVVQTSSAFLGAVAGIVITLLSRFIGDLVRAQVKDVLHELVPPAIARGLALAQLPPATTVSLRALTVDASGIGFEPAIGAIGTALSTFTPAPLPVP